ncbi:MAG: response regulator, partial [Actinobacteria bacterium]|nr:response regulator [Actinomycetota bacterium]
VLPPDPAGKRVLVVDDDLSIRRVIVKILNRKGFECSSAASVVEAQGLLETQPYALLITDMRMWGEEGLDLIRSASDDYPSMAAIMVSGLDDPDLAKKARQAGASYFIAKPVDADDLVEKVEAALEAREETIKLRKHQQW